MWQITWCSRICLRPTLRISVRQCLSRSRGKINRLFSSSGNCLFYSSASFWSNRTSLRYQSITDPHELYKNMRPSDVGTSLGSGMGGTESWRRYSRIVARGPKRYPAGDVSSFFFLWCAQSLTSPRSFVNTTARWVNLLLLSSSRPVKIPVGAWWITISSSEL